MSEDGIRPSVRDIRLTFSLPPAYSFRVRRHYSGLKGQPGECALRYFFEHYALDADRRELRRGLDVVSTTPQVFDLLDDLICNTERVASEDDLDRKRLAESRTDAIDPNRPLTQDQPILSAQLRGGNV
jgi:hypothetical protein